MAWITSLSFKTGPRRSADGKFCSGFSTDNYEAIFKEDFFKAALVNSLGIAAIATLISIVLAAMAAYALARLDFAGKAVILSGALAVAMFPPISIVGSLFDMWRDDRPLRHLARADHPVHDVHPAAGDLHAVARSSGRSRGSSSRRPRSTAPRRSRPSAR